MWWKVLGWASLIFFGGRALLGLVQTDRGAPPAAAPEAPRANIEVRVDGTKARHLTEGVTRADWGDRWPFTVDEATLICVPDFAEYGAFYAVDGRAFAANGASQTMARLRKIDVLVDGKAQRPETIEAGDPRWARGKSVGDLPLAVMKLGCGG